MRSNEARFCVRVRGTVKPSTAATEPEATADSGCGFSAASLDGTERLYRVITVRLQTTNLADHRSSAVKPFADHRAESHSRVFTTVNQSRAENRTVQQSYFRSVILQPSGFN